MVVIIRGARFAVPGGLFLYWAANDFTTLGAALHDRLALAFIADLLITTGALTVYFAKRPPGRYRWPCFSHSRFWARSRSALRCTYG